MSFVVASAPGDYLGKAKLADTFKNKAEKVKYDADFSNYQAPAPLADRFGYDAAAGAITFKGKMSLKEFEELKAAIPASDPNRKDKIGALKQLRYKSDWFESTLKTQVISPVKTLRSWAFVLCFLGIGLSTRFAELATFGLRPFWAFTLGVIVNVPLGYVLSAHVFADYWDAIK